MGRRSERRVRGERERGREGWEGERGRERERETYISVHQRVHVGDYLRTLDIHKGEGRDDGLSDKLNETRKRKEMV